MTDLKSALTWINNCLKFKPSVLQTAFFEYVEFSTYSWAWMQFARKLKIFGLHSIPAKTTPVFFKNRLRQRFFAYKVFFAAPVAEKTKCGKMPQYNLIFNFNLLGAIYAGN